MFTEKLVDSRRIVYTPSAFAKHSLLHLQETGTLTALKAHTSKRNRLASYLFFVVLDGKGRLEYDGQSYDLATGDCVFVDCMSHYSHTTDTALWSLQWAHFQAESMAGVYSKYIERGGQPVFHPKDPERYTKILDNLYMTASSQDYLRDMRINELLAALLTRIMEMSWIPENQGEIKRGSARAFSLQDVKNYLDENWAMKISLDDLANRFFINKFYMTRLFRNQYGTPILSYVLDLRITQAKRMLRFSADTVESIGMSCGFDDQNYFSRVFKKVEGVTPTEYRRMWVQ